MDFIPLPDKATSHVPIPDLGGLEWDQKGFLGYPERQGWDLKALRTGKLASARSDWEDYVSSSLKRITYIGVSKDDKAYVGASLGAIIGSFVQTWVMFGLLQEALGRPVFRHEVCKKTATMALNEDETMSSIITLQHHFAEFLKKGSRMEDDPAWRERLFHCLDIASRLLWDLGSLYGTIGHSLPPVRIHLALTILVETLHYHTYLLCGRQPKLQESGTGECLPFQQMLIDDRGWCPNMTARIVSTLGIEGLYYTSLLPTFETGYGHDECQAGVCVASNIDQDAYEVMHALANCRCNVSGCDHKKLPCSCYYLGLSEIELASAFDGGAYPLIRFDHDKVDLVRYQSGIDYIAISHVWSDGRGNPRTNALPQCQLQAIQHHVAGVTTEKSALFWIDTLCVPIREPLRNTAIVRMAEVYSSASHVLVLSEDLLSVNLPTTPDECLVRIVCSQWASRLWTMQEAVLARHLVFGFANADVCQPTLCRILTDAKSHLDGRSRQVGTVADRAIDRMIAIRKPTDQHDLAISWFNNSLLFRSTSRTSDVAICGSILLGCGLETVLSVPDDEKMQAFWSCRETVPASIVWAARGPRLKRDGFRWAPSNLLHAQAFHLPIDETIPSAVPTAAGLLVTGLNAIVLEGFCWPRAETAALRFLLPSMQQKYFCIKGNNAEQETWAEVQQSWRGPCVLLISQRELEMKPTSPTAALVLPANALINRSRNENSAETIHARFFTQVILFTEDTSWKRKEEVDDHDSAEALRNLVTRGLVKITDVPKTQHIGPSQQWCIF